MVLVGCTGIEPAARPRAAASPADQTQKGRPAAAAPSAPPTPQAFDTASDGAGTPVAVTVEVGGPRGSLAGLHEAGTVVEHPLSSRTTGLVVVTHGGTAPVGPLRPATAGDATTAATLAADLVTMRASTAIVAELRSAGRRVTEEHASDGSVVRDPTRRAPYNTYARPGLARRRPPRRGDGAAAVWSRAATAPAGGRPAPAVDVAVTPQAQVSWTWDRASASWLRTVRGRPEHLADGGRVSATTVVVLEATNARAGLGALSGVGPAAVLRGGRRYGARWTRRGAGVAPSLESRDGAAFPVDGRVWTIVCATPCAQQIAPLAPRPRDGAR